MALLPARIGVRALAALRLRLGRWLAGTHVHGLGLGLIVVVLWGAGALAPLERLAWRAVRAGEGAVPRSEAPLVIAIDDDAVARLGPPPWPAEVVVRVGRALRRQGIDEVLVADPWPLLMRPSPDATPADVALLVPELRWRDGDLPPPPAPLTAVRATLASPPPGGGRWWESADLAPDRPWLPCVLGGACAREGARVALRDVDVPVVSLADVLDAEGAFLRPPDAGATLGLTAAPFAPSVTLPSGVDAPWVVGVSALLGSAAAHGAFVVAPPIAGLAWLLAWLAFAALSRARTPSRRWLALAPVLAGVTAVAAEQVGQVALPLCGAVLVAAAPGVAREAATLRGALLTLRRLGLLVLRAATRAGMLRRALRTQQEVLAALADLTRNHLADRPIAWLYREPHSDRLVFGGGFGVSRGDLVPSAFDLGNPQLAAVLGTTDGGLVPLLRDRARGCRVIPMRQADRVVGLWLIAWDPGDQGPDPRHVGQLAGWVSERLTLEDHPGAFAGLGGMVPEDARDDTLERLLRATETERNRWRRALRASGVPMLFADVSGMLSDINPAMVDALQRAGLPRVRSLRELLFRLRGEDGLDALVARLFADGRAVELPWPSPETRWRLRIAQVQPEPGETELTYGFIGWLEPEEDDDVRALEDRIRHWSHDVEARLTAVFDAAEALAASDAVQRREHMVRFLRQELGTIADTLREVGGAVEARRSGEAGPIDLVRLLRSEARRIANLLEAAELTVAWTLPPTDPTAWGVSRDVTLGVRALLEALVQVARPRGEAQLAVRQRGDLLEVRLVAPTRADELLGAFLDTPGALDVDSAPAPVRGLVLARDLLRGLDGAVDHGVATLTFRLQAGGPR